MTKAIEQMQHDPDPELGGAVLLSSTIRLLIDPESMLTNTTASGAPSMRTEKTEFLNYFYLHCMPTLIIPLRTISKDAASLKGIRIVYKRRLFGLPIALVEVSTLIQVEENVYLIKNENYMMLLFARKKEAK